MHLRFRGALVALLLTAGPLLGLGALTAPAYAAGSFCDDGGVNVAVDYGSLGGGVEQTCVEDGAGKTADKVFADAGFELTPVGEFPGAACQVDGKPSDASCAKMPPANAYWGLYLGTDGKWDYAPKGADQLELQDGSFVAFAWQDTKKSTPPSVEPTQGAGASPSEAAQATDQGTQSAEAEDDGGLAPWIPVAVIAVLIVAAIAVVASRRRSSDA